MTYPIKSNLDFNNDDLIKKAVIYGLVWRYIAVGL